MRCQLAGVDGQGESFSHLSKPRYPARLIDGRLVIPNNFLWNTYAMTREDTYVHLASQKGNSLVHLAQENLFNNSVNTVHLASMVPSLTSLGRVLGPRRGSCRVILRSMSRFIQADVLGRPEADEETKVC